MICACVYLFHTTPHMEKRFPSYFGDDARRWWYRLANSVTPRAPIRFSTSLTASGSKESSAPSSPSTTPASSFGWLWPSSSTSKRGPRKWRGKKQGGETTASRYAPDEGGSLARDGMVRLWDWRYASQVWPCRYDPRRTGWWSNSILADETRRPRNDGLYWKLLIYFET